MRLSIQRSVRLLARLMLLGPLVACALLSFSVTTQRLRLPPVLFHNQVVWIGDLCRTYGEHSLPYMRECPAGYTVDVFVHGTPMRHYVVVQIPTLR
jgi:hypothetical protein